jgi:2-deoxy-D-gluconate 3-dehydrogenase
MTDLFSLAGKVAIITGGNGGIGKALALSLASAGADVVIAARNKTKTQSAIQEISQKTGRRIEGIETDVLQERQILAMVEKAAHLLGGIDILINNSGIAEGKLPQDVTAEEWDRVIGTNLRGSFLCSKAVYPYMQKRGGGKIINIGSMASLMGSSVLPAYSSSKGGIVQLTKSLAVAWAVDNIQVNAILPGWFKTDLGGRTRGSAPNMDARITGLTPMGRFGQLSELGGAAIFLTSRASDFVTGVSIPVDGGYSIALRGLDGPFPPPKKSPVVP